MVLVKNPGGIPVILMTFADITESIEYQKQRDHIAETIGSGLAKICFSKDKLEVLYANRSFYEMWPKDMIMKGTFWEKESYEQYISKPLFGQDSSCPAEIEFEYPCLNAKNENVWIDVRGVYTTRIKDQPVYVFVFNDITKLKNIEIEQMNILRHIPGGVAKFRIDETFSFVEANEYFYEYFHTNNFELSNGGLRFIYEKDYERVRRIIEKKSVGRADIKFICRIPSLEGIKWFMVCGTYSESIAGVMVYQFLFVECTKQEELRIALEKERERYQIALQNTSNIIFEYDGEQDSFLYFQPSNDSGRGETGKKIISDYGKKVKSGELVHPNDAEYIYKICRDCSVKHIHDLQIRAKKIWERSCEEYIWYEVQGTVMKDEQGTKKIIGVMRNISLEKEQESEQAKGLECDKLTKLYSKDTVSRLADEYLASSKDRGNSALLMITVENFMLVNDRYGHMFGDVVLSEIAEHVRNVFEAEKGNNITGRFGGIEFGVFSEKLTREELIRACEKLCNLIQNVYVGEDDRISISCKIGITFARRDDDFLSLTDRARKVMFRLKYEENKTYGFEDETELDIEKLDKSEEFLNFNSDELYESSETRDIVAFAFDVLERTKDVKSAINILLRRIGIQFNIERVTVFEVDEHDRILACKYQWAKSVNLLTKGQMITFEEAQLERIKQEFDREGILETGTDEYPPFSRMPKESIRAQTVLMCALYEEGRYEGHLLFEQFGGKNELNESQKNELKEITKIISTYLAKIRADEASRYKGEFLSRMSHEIRTPMNAICGMTDLLLQSDLTGLNEEYVQTIKKASDNLLGIVNDILDFSKIEAGKLEIISEEYELKIMVDELITLVSNKLADKPVSFYTRINPGIPKVLYGDEARIRQIVLNLLTNAVKYTEQGFVELAVDYEELQDKNEMQLYISVKDSGIGIRKEDIDKLFAEFQQVDTRRNRKVEGTGLGLAISRQLAELMDGKIYIESEYGKGTIFTLKLKQSVYSDEPAVKIRNPSRISMLVYERDIYYCRGLQKICKDLQLQVHFEKDKEEFLNKAESGEYTHVLFDYDTLFYDIQKIIAAREKVSFVSMLNSDSSRPREIDNDNHCFLFKPLTIYSMDRLFNVEGRAQEKRKDFQQFIAPDARILIIDDNQVNLKVAQGLLKGYQCRIDMASSGFEALHMVIENPDYDILFIDHMMPDMDGVETLQHIRSRAGDYGKNVAAVALTANALREARELFSANSFQDFLAKPIDLKLLHHIMNKWIPENKKQALPDQEKGRDEEWTIPDSIRQRIHINGVNEEAGMRCSGNSINRYLGHLYIIAHAGKTKAEALKASAQTNDYQKYGLQIKALKAMAENIGACRQLDMVQEHEAALKEARYEYINQEYMKLYNAYQYLLKQMSKVLLKEENRIPSLEKTKKHKLLLVADDPAGITIAEQALSDDYQLICVTSGMNALNLLEYFEPELILLDVKMEETDEIEIWRQIHKMEKTVYLEKPFTQEEVLKKINNALSV